MIETLYIHNYKCFSHFEINLTETPTTLLIGKNGVGKSALRDVLGMLQCIGSGINRIGNLVQPSDYYLGHTREPMRFHLRCKIREKVYQFEIAFELPPDFRELRIKEESLVINGYLYYSRTLADVTIYETDQLKEKNFSVDWHTIVLPMIQEKQTERVLSDFRDWLARIFILSPQPSAISGNADGEALLPNREVSNFGEWFKGFFGASPNSYKFLDKYIQQVMPDFKSIQIKRDERGRSRLMVEFEKQEHLPINIAFRDLSDGEKCFFICGTVLATHQAHGSLVCFWDEPDNYLSLSEVGLFIKALRREFHKTGQLLITSHNPEAVRKFSDENTWVLTRNSHLDPTRATLLEEIPLQEDTVLAMIQGDL